MNTLCFTSNLTSVELAAWVQAIGSIVAILLAVIIAVWQVGRQHTNALSLQSSEQRIQKQELTKTLSFLANFCSTVMVHIAAEVNSRETVQQTAQRLVYSSIGELISCQSDLGAIPIHDLPSSLAKSTVFLKSVVRQFHEKFEMALKVHENMDSQDFEIFFRELGEMNASLKATCDDIASEVERVQKE